MKNKIKEIVEFLMKNKISFLYDNKSIDIWDDVIKKDLLKNLIEFGFFFKNERLKFESKK